MGIEPVSTSRTEPPDSSFDPNSIGLCKSGGGYRAMLFHVGTIWRLNELGWLPRLNRISSVSGGSITAGVLGMNWNKLGFVNGVSPHSLFGQHFVDPLRHLASKTIDRHSVIGGILSPFHTVSEFVADAYDDILFNGALISDLPDGTAPRFIINATNVQTGSLFRFTRDYVADYKIGICRNPAIRLADAVAASSAFPPVLSPFKLRLDPREWESVDGSSLHDDSYRSEVVLSDGGVYDNHGLETIWKRCGTVLVSDGGAKLKPDAHQHDDWARHAYRVLDIIDDQVRSLRRRVLIESFRLKLGDGSGVGRNGAYWGIGTEISKYGLADSLPFTPDDTRTMATVPTRLEAMKPDLQKQLINWGYAVCDAAMRTHVISGQPVPKAKFPY